MTPSITATVWLAVCGSSDDEIAMSSRALVHQQSLQLQQEITMRLIALSLVAVAICVVIMAPQSASAQCTYRMLDVGRPHGYVSGPCNGAALNLAGAYPTPAARTPVPVKANKRVNRRASSR